MEVIRELDLLPAAPGGRAIALGTFDGVHLGHQAVIASAVEHAGSGGLRSCVVTFEPHPAKVLRPDIPLALLSSLDTKIAKVDALDATELLAIPFTQQLADMSAEQFCAEVIEAELGAKFVSVGANFRFGHKALGDAELLRTREGFETQVMPLVEHQGEPISSSRIRELIEQGSIDEANELLGSPFVFEGVVVAGDCRGRELGMPTANIEPDGTIAVPGRGVYAALAQTDRGEFPAAVNVGVRPTFESDGKLLVEPHLIGFDGDLYGTVLRLAFLERLRDEMRFESADELVAQMQTDVAAAEKIAAEAASGVRAP